MMEKSYARRQIWKSIIAFVMLGTGAACFIFACVAAMIVTGKE